MVYPLCKPKASERVNRHIGIYRVYLKAMCQPQDTHGMGYECIPVKKENPSLGSTQGANVDSRFISANINVGCTADESEDRSERENSSKSPGTTLNRINKGSVHKLIRVY